IFNNNHADWPDGSTKSKSGTGTRLLARGIPASSTPTAASAAHRGNRNNGHPLDLIALAERPADGHGVLDCPQLIECRRGLYISHGSSSCSGQSAVAGLLVGGVAPTGARCLDARLGPLKRLEPRGSIESCSGSRWAPPFGDRQVTCDWVMCGAMVN